jgi:hypothetical protein
MSIVNTATESFVNCLQIVLLNTEVYLLTFIFHIYKTIRNARLHRLRQL